MLRKSLLEKLARYQKSSLITTYEQDHYSQFVDFITAHPNCFERSCKGHITGSAWILNRSGTHVLLTHHKKFNCWLQLGGHADGDPDTLAVALKEAREESGIETLKLVSSEIFDISIHPIPNSCFMHYDVRYLLQASDDENYKVSPESHDLAWVALEEIPLYSTNDSLARMARKNLTPLSTVS